MGRGEGAGEDRFERVDREHKMAFRMGLSEKRKEVLEKELERILPLLIKLGVKKVILFGSLSGGKIHQSSDIDLLVVSPRFDRERQRTDIDLLWRVAARTDSRIEPVPVASTNI